MSARHLKRDGSRYKQLAKNQKIPKASYTSKFSDSTKFLLPSGVPLFEFGCSLTQTARCARVITRTSRKNILSEFGCSLTPEAVKRSSDYSQKRPSNLNK